MILTVKLSKFYGDPVFHFLGGDFFNCLYENGFKQDICNSKRGLTVISDVKNL